MAYVNPNQAVPGVQAGTPGKVPISSGGAGMVGAPSKSAAKPGQNIPAQPSAQLSAYLSANAPQAEAFGQNIANTVGGQVNAAGDAINQAVNTYAGQQYKVPTNEAVNAKVSTSPSSLTPEERSIYQTQLGAQAKAPNAANTFETTSPYQGLTSGIQKAVEQANLWSRGNDLASLSTALAPFEGSNTTAGGKTLDSLLLSRTPGAYNKIQAATAPAAGLQGQLEAGTTQANKALQDAISADTATTQSAQDAAQQFVPNLNSSLSNQIAQNQGKISSENAAILQNLKNPQAIGSNAQFITPDSYTSQLGLTPQQWDSLVYGSRAYPESAGVSAAPVDLASYLSQTAPQNTTLINAANSATPQQYSDVQAIMDMLGSNAPTNLPLDMANSSQAGNLPQLSSFNQFNTGAAMAAIQAYLDAAKNAGVVTPPVTVPAPTPTNPAPTPVIGRRPPPVGAI